MSKANRDRRVRQRAEFRIAKIMSGFYTQKRVIHMLGPEGIPPNFLGWLIEDMDGVKASTYGDIKRSITGLSAFPPEGFADEAPVPYGGISRSGYK